MKKAFLLFFYCVLLSACSPSDSMIQTAIAETSIAQPTITNTPIPTATIIPTPTPTPVPGLDGDWVKFNDNQSSPGFVAQWASHFDQNSLSSYYAYQDERNTSEITRVDESQYFSNSYGTVFDYEFSSDGSIMLRRYTYGGINYFDYFGRMTSDQPLFVYGISENPSLNRNIHLVYPGPDFRTEVLTNEKRDDNPTFSPDNLRIAFLRYEDTNGDGVYDGYDSISNLYQMNIDGTNFEKLTNDIGSIWDYSWSPQGNQIVFVSNWNCYMLDLATKNVSNFYNGEVCNFPTWSPDGEWIAFWHKASDGLLYPTVARPDGSDGHAVSDTGVDRIYTLQWMADGRLIYSIKQDSYELVKIGDELNSHLIYSKEVPVLAANSQNLFNWSKGYATDFPKDDKNISSHNIDMLVYEKLSVSLDLINFPRDQLAAIKFSPTKPLIAMARTAGQISVWNFMNGNEEHHINGDNYDICRLFFKDNTNHLIRVNCLSDFNIGRAFSEGKNPEDNISLIDLSDGSVIETFHPILQNVNYTPLFYAIEATEKGVFLVEKTSQGTDTIYFLDFTSGTTRIAYTIPYKYRGSFLTISTDGMLVNASNQVFDRITGGLIGTIPVSQTNYTLGFSPDNQVAFIFDRNLAVINAVDIISSDIIYTFESEQPLLYGGIVDNGKAFAAIDTDYQIHLWSLK